jgi:ABC-2 type transport system permease protein
VLPCWRSKASRNASTAHARPHTRRERAASLGLDRASVDRLEAPVRLVERPADPGRRTSGNDRIFAFVMTILLLMGLFVVNSYLAVGITGEKQARVTEVVVSAIRPQSWMDGKIVAYTIVGLVQVLVWLATLAVTIVVFGREVPAGLAPGPLLVLVAFVVLGLALYVALWALVLATIKDMQSTSKFQAYLLFMPAIPFMFIEALARNPDGPLAVWFGLFPFFSPFVVPLRLALKAIAPWEIALSLALLAATVWFLRIAAGHALRIGMLMYGKELSLPELWRWSRRA